MVEKCGFVKFFFRQNFLPYGTLLILLVATHPLNNMKFTTKDQDNDKYGGNCAVSDNGKNNNGWWQNRCSYIHLNQKYTENNKIYDGRAWHDYIFTEIKIRPINCK